MARKLSKKDKEFLKKINEKDRAVIAALFTHPRGEEIFHEMIDSFDPKVDHIESASEYFNNLKNEFSNTEDLFFYIMALEQFCFGKFKTTDRKVAYAKAVFANKNSGRPNSSSKKTINEYKERVAAVEELRIKNNFKVADACKRAGINVSNYRKYLKDFFPNSPHIASNK